MPKKDYDRTLTRLIGILSSLSLNELPTLPELAEEYNVTLRTIQKDIYQRLKSFPIVKNSEGKLYFEYGFSLDKSMLSSEEMVLVSLALAQFEEVENFNHLTDPILQKLLYPSMFNPYYIKYEDLEPLDTDSPIIVDLRKAIEDKNIIVAKFANKHVMIEPYRIANYDGFWYLFGRDVSAGKIKTFMIRKIEAIDRTEDHYKISHTQIDKILGYTHSAWFEDGEGFEVRIKVYPEIADYFRQKAFLRSQEIVSEEDDGTLIVTFEVTHDEDIDNIIKSWLPHIEVLEPKRFRQKILSELTDYINKIQS